MNDLEGMINGLLSNPDDMKKIMDMASQLMGSEGAKAASPPSGAVQAAPSLENVLSQLGGDTSGLGGAVQNLLNNNSAGLQGLLGGGGGLQGLLSGGGGLKGLLGSGGLTSLLGNPNMLRLIGSGANLLGMLGGTKGLSSLLGSSGGGLSGLLGGSGGGLSGLLGGSGGGLSGLLGGSGGGLSGLLGGGGGGLSSLLGGAGGGGIQKLLGGLSTSGMSGDKQELINAMKPYLSEKKQLKLDKAASFAKVMRAAGSSGLLTGGNRK